MTRIEGPVHLVGIGGIHMSAIAQLLLEQGVEVSGSDLQASALTGQLSKAGARVYRGHRAENIGAARLVVATAAAGDDNPEIAAARGRGIPVVLRAEMVARLMAGKQVIAVSGSHGKTTTSSLIAFILREAGLSPMYLLGGHSRDLGGHAAWGGPLCVVEADEYKRAFHAYSPWLGIVLNVEPDHLDYYGTAEAYREAFVEFGTHIQPDGIALCCADDPGAHQVALALADTRTVQTYGIEADGADWRATDLQMTAESTTFRVWRDNAVLGSMETRLPGRHAVLNVLAATAAAMTAGAGFETIAAAVEKFSGASRRFEIVGEESGVLVVDDYAHHPSEVRAILAAARQRFPGRRLIAVHQPHTYSRIAYLWEGWTSCWSGADEVVIVETYAARETPDRGKSASELAGAIAGTSVHYAESLEAAAKLAVQIARRGDVVMTIGAGDIDAAGRRLLELLR